MNIECGGSAHGETRIVTGPVFYLHLPRLDIESMYKIYNVRPQQPAWTKMNTDWRKRK